MSVPEKNIENDNNAAKVDTVRQAAEGAPAKHPQSSSRARLFTNTLMLYLRMIVSMAIGFFTVRVTLDILGAEDYGIYNVVGGLVILFSFISTILISSLQRFLTLAISKGDENELHKTFCTAMVLYSLLIGLVIIAGECVGMVMLPKLTIPPARYRAACWVL